MSSFVKLHHIQFAYDHQATALLSDVSLSFHQGWTSLCGVNGCGKSTLFKLIKGELQPQTGDIEVRGQAYLIPQDRQSPPANLNEFQHNYTRKAIHLRETLGLTDDMCSRWNSLSIGERKKIQIAVALASDPEILLVDEPTNHLDEQAKQSLLLELKRFQGVGILISHDRLLLTELCSHTVFIEDGECQVFQGAYDLAKQEMQQIQQGHIRTRELKKAERKTLQRSVQYQNEKVAQGSKKLSKRGIDKKDHDTKAKVNLARLTGADLADSRKKHILEEREQRVSIQLSNMRVKKEYKLGVFFGEVANRKRLHLPEEIWTTPFLTIHCPEFVIEAGEHIAITGPNGVGKSTFLQLWLERLTHLPIAVAKQEITKVEKEELTDELAKMDSDIKGKIFTLVSCFGSDPKSIAQGGLPSPGVWQKLVIAQAIVKGFPLLFLDEPTNHMDLAALEILEEALSLYQGILVVISHDRSFINQVCSRELALSKRGQVTTITIKDIEKENV
jgi:macrolide transport system ATP-binding/permease protein